LAFIVGEFGGLTIHKITKIEPNIEAKAEKESNAVDSFSISQRETIHPKYSI
jgi:hypothetical protein